MQKLLKNLIVSVWESGQADEVYMIFHLISLAALIGLAMWYGHKMGYNPIKGIFLVLIGFALSYVWMLIYYWILSGFKTFGPQNHVTIMIYEPLIYLIPSMLLKIDWKKTCSILAVGVPLEQGIGHIGCIFPGCCAGYPAQWGVYNVLTETYLFPNQLLEAIVAIGIAVYIMHTIKKNNYVPNARSVPMMLIMYGSTRFVLEFLRNSEKILWGCSNLAFHALFMCLVGAVALLIINKKENHSKC